MSTNLVNNKWRITRRIGGGSFGEIYLGIGPSGERVAVKFERHGTRCPQLRHEYKVYREMQNCHGFCNVYFFGVQDNYNVMVMDLLGPSLEDLFNKCGRKFSLKTVLQIADQMLERVDTLHSRHLIHRDIKPANFVVGTGEQGNAVFCVDFGLSKRYRHPKTLQHIPHRDGRSLTGTPRYASINNHLGVEQSRRDDLESIGYVLVYFIKGTLPWQGLKAKNPQKKYRMILEKKQQVSIAQLCQGIPSQFAEFLAYARSLKFDAKPDIPYLRKLFRDLYHAQGCASIPKLWDWEPIENDYLTNGSGPSGGPPALEGSKTNEGPQQMSGYGGSETRPNTTMAQGAQDTTEVGGTNMGSTRMAGDRPTTAGGNSRGQTTAASSWGFPTPSQQANPYDNGYQQQPNVSSGVRPASAVAAGNDTGNDASRRPHTAGTRQGGIASEKGGEQAEGDAVVAGARAMMRYRRTRASATEQAAGIGSSIGKSWVGENGVPQQHAYASGGQQYANQQAPTVNNISNNASNGVSRMFFQGNQQGGGVGQRVGSAQQGSHLPNAQGQKNPAAPGSSWLSGGVNNGGDTRPKSAGLFGSSGSRPQQQTVGVTNNVNRYGSQQVGQQQQGVALQHGAQSGSALSYGALKNRFLSSGQQGGVQPQTSAVNASAQASAASKSRSSSKLFTLSR